MGRQAMWSLWTLLIMILITACSGLSKRECLEQDWVRTGELEGSEGEVARERLDYYQQQCGRHGANPDVKAYEYGHGQGLRDFCKGAGREHGEKGELKARPNLCRGVKTYDMARKLGFKSYCQASGAKAGAIADQKAGDRNCWYKKSYQRGFREGLRDHCVESRGLELGKKGLDHKLHLCPKDLRFTFHRGYRRGLKVYCRKENGFVLSQSRGHYVPKKCPKDLRPHFVQAYDKGLRYSALLKKIPELNDLVRKKKGELAQDKLSKGLKTRIENDLKKIESAKIKYIQEKEKIEREYKLRAEDRD